VRWIIVPAWVTGGVLIDLIFHVAPQHNNPRAIYGITGLVYNIPGDFLLYWAFSTLLGWAWPLFFFLYGFVAIHAILGGLAGVFLPDVLNKIKPVIQ